MKKETKKQIATNLFLSLMVGSLTCIAIKCGQNNQAKRIKETTVKTSQPSRIDKVANTKNQKKIAWMEEIYNTK